MLPNAVVATEGSTCKTPEPWDQERIRRDAVRGARARGRVHQHLRLVANTTTGQRGARVARLIAAVVADLVGQGHRRDIAADALGLRRRLAEHLARLGWVPGERAWRAGLHLAAERSRFVVRDGSRWVVRLSLAAIDQPEHEALIGLGRRDTPVTTSDELCSVGRDTVGLSVVSSDHGAYKERAHATPPQVVVLSGWLAEASCSLWRARAARLMHRLGRPVSGSSRDVARALMEVAAGRPPPDPSTRRYVLHTARPSRPPWPAHLSRATVLRGLERALVWLEEQGLVLRHGDRWSTPEFEDHADLRKLGVQESSTGSRPSPRMTASLRRRGAVAPETTSAEEAMGLHRRFLHTPFARASTMSTTNRARARHASPTTTVRNTSTAPATPTQHGSTRGPLRSGGVYAGDLYRSFGRGAPEEQEPPPTTSSKPTDEHHVSTEAAFWGERWPKLVDAVWNRWGDRARCSLESTTGLHHELQAYSQRSTDSTWSDAVAALLRAKQEPGAIARYLLGILRRSVPAAEKARRSDVPAASEAAHRGPRLVRVMTPQDRALRLAALANTCNETVAHGEGVPGTATSRPGPDGGGDDDHRSDRNGG